MQDKNMEETLKGVTVKRTTSVKDIPCLVIIQGNDAGQCHPLNEGDNIVGRTKGDIYINDPEISRSHFKITLTGNKFSISDLGSSNGTFMDQKLVEEIQPIGSFSKIQAGGTVMKIEFRSSSELNYESRLLHDARNDRLTGVFNKAHFFEAAEAVLKRRSLNAGNLAVVMMDLDHFKRVNDEFGHLAGDTVLQEFAGLVKSLTRKDDLLARYGGEEFVLLIEGYHISPDVVERLSERIRKNTEDKVFNTDDGEKQIRLTVSLGVCCQMCGEVAPIKEMIRKADEALYEAKRSGRNRVVLAE